MVKNLQSQSKLAAASYLIGERLIRMFIGFFVHAWMARTLTPEDFGFISYIVKGVAVYYTFGLFGNDEVVIKELLSQKKEEQKNVLVTVTYLRLLIGTLGFVVMLLITGLASGFGSETWYWMLIFGITIPMQALTVYELPFISNMSMQPIFLARNSSYFIGVICKIIGLLKHFTKSSFIIIYMIEEFFGKFFSAILAFKQGWCGGKFNSKLAYYLLGPSLLSFFASFILLFDQRLPFLVLDYFGSATEIGKYAVVITLLDIALLFPVSLATAIFPSVVHGKNTSLEAYEKNRQHLANCLIWLGFAFAIFIWPLAPLIIKLLYGGKYLEVIPLLRGLAFTSILNFYNVGRFKWFVLDKALPDWIALLTSGLIIQSLALYLLIPQYGLSGIIGAVLLGQIIPNLLLVWRKNVRESLKIFFRSLKIQNFIP